jgi:hypothetical protein
MAEKAKFVMQNVSVSAIKDKVIAAAVASDLPKGVEGGIGSAGEMVKSLGKGEEGFGITLTVETMEVTKDGKFLSALIKGTISELPKDAYKANLTFKGKTEAPDPKRMDKEMKSIARSFGEGLGKDIVKQIK